MEILRIWCLTSYLQRQGLCQPPQIHPVVNRNPFWRPGRIIVGLQILSMTTNEKLNGNFCYHNYVTFFNNLVPRLSSKLFAEALHARDLRRSFKNGTKGCLRKNYRNRDFTVWHHALHIRIHYLLVVLERRMNTIERMSFTVNLNSPFC